MTKSAKTSIHIRVLPEQKQLFIDAATRAGIDLTSWLTVVATLSARSPDGLPVQQNTPTASASVPEPTTSTAAVPVTPAPELSTPTSAVPKARGTALDGFKRLGGAPPV